MFGVASNSTRNESAGRGKVTFFNFEGNDLVLRHYRRGGLPAKFSRDRYWWQGLANTRAWREFHLLQTLESMHLPAPRPYAARVEKSRMFYRADIVTHEIDGAVSLMDRVRSADFDSGIFEQTGAVIAQFHRAGVNHVDLNASNIVLDKNGDVHLLDFDRCKIEAAKNDDWKQGNLDRLQRSLKKSFPDFDARLWQALLGGYTNC